MIDTSVLVKEYLEGKSMAALGRKYNCSSLKIKNILVSQGVHIRSRNEQNKYSPQNQRVYNINDLYFTEQNNNMAYLLGFIAADGTIRKDSNGIKIGLSSVDIDFLIKINQELSSNYPVKTYETKYGYSVSEVVWSSHQIKKDLSEYNIVPNKTYNFTFPSKLKKEYYKDFIRGYFDGDGSISTVGSAIRWQVCAYKKDVLEKIVKYFEECGIPKVNIYKYSNKELYYIQYSTNSTKAIYNILYYDNCLCLPRKKEKYLLLLK